MTDFGSVSIVIDDDGVQTRDIIVENPLELQEMVARGQTKKNVDLSEEHSNLVIGDIEVYMIKTEE